MTEITHGRVQRKVELLQTYTEYLANGALATDAAQLSTGTTVATSEVEVYNELIDPGVMLSLKEAKAQLVFNTTFLGSAIGSMTYTWFARSEWDDPVGTHRVSSYIGITPTMQGPVGSAVNNVYTATLAGYIPVASLAAAPVRLKLTAKASANSFTGQVYNSSYLKLTGIVIPGA